MNGPKCTSINPDETWDWVENIDVLCKMVAEVGNAKCYQEGHQLTIVQGFSFTNAGRFLEVYLMGGIKIYLQTSVGQPLQVDILFNLLMDSHEVVYMSEDIIRLIEERVGYKLYKMTGNHLLWKATHPNTVFQDIVSDLNLYEIKLYDFTKLLDYFIIPAELTPVWSLKNRIRNALLGTPPTKEFYMTEDGHIGMVFIDETRRSKSLSFWEWFEVIQRRKEIQ
jgi:hypothetical protein